MPDPTDAELAAWVAEKMGADESGIIAGQCRARWWGNSEWEHFAPLADGARGWADFGRVWEWAEKEYAEWDICLDWHSVAFGEEAGEVFVGHGPIRRSLLLALWRTENG